MKMYFDSIYRSDFLAFFLLSTFLVRNCSLSWSYSEINLLSNNLENKECFKILLKDWSPIEDLNCKSTFMIFFFLFTSSKEGRRSNKVFDKIVSVASRLLTDWHPTNLWNNRWLKLLCFNNHEKVKHSKQYDLPFFTLQ